MYLVLSILWANLSKSTAEPAEAGQPVEICGFFLWSPLEACCRCFLHHLQSTTCLGSTTCPTVMFHVIFIFHQVPSTKTIIFKSSKSHSIHIQIYSDIFRCSQLFSIHIQFSCPKSCSTHRHLSSFCVPFDSLLVSLFVKRPVKPW